MKVKTVFSFALYVFWMTGLRADDDIPNRFIDYDGFLSQASDVGKARAHRRITEEEFIRMASDPANIVFDARSTEKYRKLHIKGAKHLSLPDITEEELSKLIPSKETAILIYCNNNFLNEPEAFPPKAPSASLNIHTFNTLYSYGYTNIYELGPAIDIKKAKIIFEGEKQIAQ
jgi:hypothetical protein